MGGHPDELYRPAVAKILDIPQQGTYQQIVPVDAEGDEPGHFDLPPSYEEAASAAAAASSRAGGTTPGAAGGSHQRQQAPVSRDSSLDADADDALLRGTERAHRREQRQRRTSTDSDVDISGYSSTDPMRWQLRERNGDWDRYDDLPGFCMSSTGGCCFSTRGGCCFSDRGGCCFSDREAGFFSDRAGCFFSDTAGCCFSSGGACCCSVLR